MQAISCFFLDIGGVLLSKGWGHEFRKQATDHFNMDAFKMEERHTLFFTIYEEGRITLDEYLDKVVFYTNRNFSRDEFKDFMFSLSTLNSEMYSFIKRLKLQYGLKIIAVSNEGRELNSFRIKKFKLNEIFDFFVSSCYFHIRKPDAAIFQLAIDGAQVHISKIVYIDDEQIFIDVATDLGITSIHHTDYLTTSKKLADMGLKETSEKNEYDQHTMEVEIIKPSKK